MSLKRLNSLEKRLDSNECFASLYYKEMERFIENGYARKIENIPPTKTTWYIPHFGVTTKGDKGDKVRIVFDAAAKSGGISLNDCLLQGPTLLMPLIGILMRFRQKRIGIKGDIQDMFLRIKLREEDTNAQRFLWRGKDRIGPPSEYVMNSLIFGSKSSPTSAIYVKNKNAEEHKSKMPKAAWAIQNSSYVDDFLDSYDSREEAIKAINEVTEINRQGGFRLHTWISNDEQVSNTTKPISGGTKNDIDLNLLTAAYTKPERALGLKWDINTDTFKFNVSFKGIDENILRGSRRPSKREFLKTIMSVYDPLGFISPLLVRSKLIMQDIWVSGIAWDSQIGDKEFESWKEWLKIINEAD